MHSIDKDYPNIWSLMNQKAQRRLPRGIEQFLSGDEAAEGRRLLRIADATIDRLISKASKTIVGDAYRRDLSGVGSETKLAELLCEISAVEALSRICGAKPCLRPETMPGKHCDVKLVMAKHDLFCEVKRLADQWAGGVRSIVKAPPDLKPPNIARPRAMDVFSKLTDAHAQLLDGKLNLVVVFHPSVWNSHIYLRQALFGDSAGFNEQSQPDLHEDGLFALNEWQKISACAFAHINPQGAFSIVQLWRNPNADVSLPDSVRDRLQVIG